MKLWVITIACALLAAATIPLGAATSPPKLLIRTPAFLDKLTQQTVSQSFQDSTGALWFVTQEGLNKYTGHELETYRHEPSNPTSRPSHLVRELTEDHDGVIWIATLGGGLGRYDEVTNSFQTFSANPNDANTPYSNDIYGLFVDFNGNLWVGYRNGFSVLDPKSHQFHHYISGNGSIPYMGEVKDFAQTTDGRIWAATQESGLLEINDGPGNIDKHIHSQNDPTSIAKGSLFSLFVDHNDAIWIASEDNGLSRFDPSTQQATRFVHDETNLESLSSNKVTSIFEDQNGTLWIGTTEGLDLYRKEDGSFYRYGPHNLDLPDFQIYSINQSREGIYWIGTRTSLFAGVKTQFEKYDTLNGNLSDKSVNAFAETKDGSIWVGTDDGLNRLRPGHQRFEWINESTDPAISSAVVMSLLGEENYLWIGTYDNGLNRLDLDTNTLEVFRHSPVDPNSLSANGVTSIFRTSSGELLVGTYGGGLNIYQGGSQFKTLKNRLNDETSISSNNVLAIHEDRYKNIWVGTVNGLNLFDPKTGSFQRFAPDPNREDGLSSKNIWSFLEDSRGNLWMGTEGGGLELWEAEDRRRLDPKFKHYSDNIALPSASVYGIQQDEDGWLWLSHNKGLTRMEPQSLDAHQYGPQDGLQSAEFNLGASFKSSDGTIYFGGIAGFNAISPAEVSAERTPPKLAISRILVMNERREFDSPYHALKEIELGYQDRMFSVEFYAADYTNPDLVNYAYKLDGINPDWVVSPEARIASFTTLPAGRYELKLAAASPDGTWNWNGISLSLVVAPPPWKSPWAYSVYALMLFALIGYYFHRQKQKEREAIRIQRELEQRVEERTRDLEAARKEAEEATKAKSDFLATMTHEIRTPMHGIIGMTELLLHTNLSGQQHQFAKAAHKSGESLLGLINEILDFSKVEASKVELESVDFNLIEVLEDICYLQGEPASKKGLSLNHICDPTIPTCFVGDPTKLRQVIMNLVSNSIKFTHEGNVNVRADAKILKSDQGKAIVHICVEDEGIGMDDETQKRVFEPFTQADTSTTRQYGGTGLGLSISRHYIDLMGGDINVQSVLGRGTRITISIPLPVADKQDNDVPSLEGMAAVIFSSNIATTEMLSAVLERAGIRTYSRAIGEILEATLPPCEVIVLDPRNSSIPPEMIMDRTDLQAQYKLFLTPLSDTPMGFEYPGWTTLVTPVKSEDLYELLASNEEILDEGSQGARDNANSSAEKRVLVAEDVITNQRIVKEMLELLNFEVDIAGNGQLAVDMFATKNYALVFMDCQMPIMDGYQASREIRRLEQESGASRAIPIVALTAGSDDKDKERCRSAGMTDYLTKPFTLADIKASISTHFNGASESINHKTSPPKDKPLSPAPFKRPDTTNVSQDIIGSAAIDSIREVEQQTGSPLLPTLFAGYQEQMEVKLQELQSHVKTRNHVELYRTAHAIKSMSANIGAERVREISDAIEQGGKKELYFEEEKPSVSDLILAYQEFQNAFEELIAEPNS
ncbi:MAG: hybrid sensor histidine kinase/response regulator [Halioglobus sp.]